MSNSKRSSAKFWIFASLVVALSAAGVAGSWPYAVAQAHADSSSLTTQAGKLSGGESQSDYQLAVWLNTKNQPARLGLAQSELAGYQPQAALLALQGAGESSRKLRLMAQAQIETGNYGPAAVTATHLTAPATATQDDIVLALLADKLAGEGTQMAALTSRLSSPQAVQDTARIQAGKLPLASVLYVRGLLHSSSAILVSLPESFERDLLLARINYSFGSSSNLQSAIKYLQLAIHDDPAALEPHQLLVTIYRDQNVFTEAGDQQALVTKLQSGRP